MRARRLILVAGLAAGVVLMMARLNGAARVPAADHDRRLPAPVRHAQPSVVAGVVASSASQRPQVWDEKYGSSTDALSFIRGAARAGIGGDGRAAYYVSDVIRRCSAMNRVEGESADAWLQRQQVEAAAMEGTAADKAQFQIRAVNLHHYCGTLIGHDAFDGLDAKGGNPELPSFWLNLARNAGDTLAWAEKLTQQLRTLDIGGQLTDEQKNTIRQQAAQLVSTTVADASASEIYSAAAVVGAWDGPSTASNTEDSYVMMLAACELGYDCTWSNPDLSLLAQCSAAGSCPTVNTLQDWIQQQLAYSGDVAYAEAFSRATQFAGYVRSGSADLALGLLRFQVPQSGPDTARPAAPSAVRR